MVKDQKKCKLSAMGVGKSLVRYRMIATFKNKGWMKLMIHTGKYMAQLLTNQLALMMKTVLHDHENDVHKLKETEKGELQIVKKQIVALSNLSPALILLNS